MRRFRLPLLFLFLFSASLIGFAQGRSGSGVSGSSSSTSGASSHSSGPAGGSSSSTSSASSHSGGGSSSSSHSSVGASHSAPGGSRAGSRPAASHANREDSRTSRSSQLSSEKVKSKPQQPTPTKLNPQQPTTKPHHWLTRLFHRPQPELAKAPKPCLGKNCPPPPPKPCKGQNCPAPPPPPCGPGTVSNGHGGCVATNHTGNDVCTTNPQASGCPASLVQNQYSNCAALRVQLQQAILELDRLQQAMNSACAAHLQSTQCISLTQRYNAEALQVESLRQRLMACR